MSRSSTPSGNSSNHELRDALAALADETASTAEHPDLDRLIAFQEQRLDSQLAEEVEEHVATCPDCNSTLLDLTVFANDVAGGPDTRDDLADALAWRTMRDQLLDSKRQATDNPPIRESASAANAEEEGEANIAGPARERDRRPSWSMALAAGLLLAVVGLGVFASLERQRSADLAEQVAVLTAPQHDVPILYLDAVTRSQTIDRPSIAIGKNDRWVVIIAPPSEQETWSARLLAKDGETVWSAEALRPNDLGTLRLSFALPPAPYRLELRAGEETHRYEFAVRTDPAQRRRSD